MSFIAKSAIVRWLLAAVIACAVIVLPTVMCRAQDSDLQSQGMQVAPEEKIDSDSIRFYTFIDPTHISPTIRQKLFHWRSGVFGKGIHPMAPWRAWANKPKKFGVSLCVILFFAVVLWALVPRWLQMAQEPVKSKFWSTLGIGVVVLVVGITAVKAALGTLIGWPLGICLVGFGQLMLMAGLSVVVSAIGQRTANLIKMPSWPLIGQRAGVQRFAELLIGSLICALLLIIPTVGTLPLIGTRLVGLLALLGLGALFRTRPGINHQS